MNKPENREQGQSRVAHLRKIIARDADGDQPGLRTAPEVELLDLCTFMDRKYPGWDAPPPPPDYPPSLKGCKRLAARLRTKMTNGDASKRTRAEYRAQLDAVEAHMIAAFPDAGVVATGKNKTVVRPMAPAEVAWALGLAAAEGWNPGVRDAASFYAADPGGFLIAHVGDEPVGCISAVAYGADFGFIGLYIVVPAQRGRGHGMALWRAAMGRLEGRNVGLDGVLEQQANYQRSGFRLAYRNVRYEGQPGAFADAAPDADLVPLATVPFETIAAYDRLVFPAPRDAFLKAWTTQPDATGLALMRHGQLAGFGTVRRCETGAKVGPLFADDAAGAEALLRGLAARAGDGPIFVDVPAANPPAIALAERLGMTRVFETARMYTGPDPAIDVARTFGVTTFELG